MVESEKMDVKSESEDTLDTHGNGAGMGKGNPTKLAQGRLLRALERAWAATATLTIVGLLGGVSYWALRTMKPEWGGANSGSGLLAGAQEKKKTEPGGAGEERAEMPPVAGQQRPVEKTLAQTMPKQGQEVLDTQEKTRVLSSTSENSKKTAVETGKPGEAMTLKECLPDVPVYAKALGQWREGTIVFVRGATVMVRFVDTSYSDEEFAAADLRRRHVEEAHAPAPAKEKAKVPVGPAKISVEDLTPLQMILRSRAKHPLTGTDRDPERVADPKFDFSDEMMANTYLPVDFMANEPGDVVRFSTSTDALMRDGIVLGVKMHELTIEPKDAPGTRITTSYGNVWMRSKTVIERWNARREVGAQLLKKQNLISVSPEGRDLVPGLVALVRCEASTGVCWGRVLKTHGDLAVVDVPQLGFYQTIVHIGSMQPQFDLRPSPIERYREGDLVEWIIPKGNRIKSTFQRIKEIKGGKITLHKRGTTLAEDIVEAKDLRALSIEPF